MVHSGEFFHAESCAETESYGFHVFCGQLLLLPAVTVGVTDVFTVGSISKVLDPVVLAVAVPMQDFVALWAGAVERCCHQSVDVDSLSVQEYSLILRTFVSDRFQQLPGFAGFVSFTSAAWLVYQRSVQAADPSVATCLVLPFVTGDIPPDFFCRNNL